MGCATFVVEFVTPLYKVVRVSVRWRAPRLLNQQDYFLTESTGLYFRLNQQDYFLAQSTGLFFGLNQQNYIFVNPDLHIVYVGGCGAGRGGGLDGKEGHSRGSVGESAAECHLCFIA